MERRPKRRVTAAIGTVGLLAAGLAIPAGAGEIETHTDGDAVPAVRYAGDDRFDTAALIATDDTDARATFDTDDVILARGDLFPDGLAGSLLSGAVDAPVLLTLPDVLPDTTQAALDELDPATVHVLGGPDAVDPALEEALEDDGYAVNRVGGIDRFETAVRIAAEANTGSDTAIVALGTNFPDALVAGPLSAVGGFPLLLTATDVLPDVTAQALQDLDIATVLLAGGPNAVSPGVEDAIEDLGIDVQRVFGDTRYETATAFADWAVANLGFTTTHVNLATGEKFPDALTLAAHAAADYSGPAPIVLTPTGFLPETTEMWLRDHAEPDNSAIHVAGGEMAIADDVVAAARAAFTPAGWTTPAMFADGLQMERARTHLQAFQNIADRNGGDRASGNPGYDASLAYVKGLLDDAGYVTDVQPFDFVYFEETETPEFEQTAGTNAPQTYTPATSADTEGTDFATMEYSGSGDVTAPITAVDLSVDSPADSDSGCETEDFASFPDGDIALVQRGACAFAQKATNAFDAGAVGVIIFNTGTDGATDTFFGTLGGPIEGAGPVIGTSHAVGVALADDDADGNDVAVRIDVQTFMEERSTANLLAETPGGDPNNVVMAGGHLDSVAGGAGINDNGTGVAAVLETALQLARSDAPVTNKVRFAFWGAEENGLVGSWEYVLTRLIDAEGELTEEGEGVALYLNFDMVGSPNFARFVYDGDGDTFGIGDPASGVIESGFVDFFDAAGLANEPSEFSGRSDYAGFQALGMPTGGLFTGAEVEKTRAQVRLYGGVAGEAFDRCYHAECDTMSNVNFIVFEQMLKAIGHEVYTYALSTDDVDAAASQEDGGARAPARAGDSGGELAYRGDHLAR